MHKPILKATTVVAAVLFVTACSEAPKPAAEAKKEPEKAPEAIAAKNAFYAMYKPARAWATDLLPLSLASGELEGIKNVDGKAGKWTAVFVSPSRREACTFFYTVTNAPGVSKGVSNGGAQPWGGATAKSKPFANSEFVVNSDDAYKTAFAEGEAYLKKHPDKSWSMVLASASRFHSPVWYIIWGDRKEGYETFVNATSGAAISGKK